MHEYDGDKIYAEEQYKIAAGEKPDQLKLMFLPLMNSTNSVSEQAKAAIKLSKQSNLPSEQLRSLISAIIVLANKILTKEDINNIWEEISMLKVIQFAEEKGMEKGMAEGMEKGIGKGMQDIIYKQLLIKFKNIPVEYKEKLKTQDHEKLEIIGMKLMEMQKLDELNEYLS